MKKRLGFVSNSSSSSFIIKKKDIDFYQIELLKTMEEVIKNNSNLHQEYYEETTGWHIIDNEEKIVGWTSMDNYNIAQYLDFIGISPDKITWED